MLALASCSSVTRSPSSVGQEPSSASVELASKLKNGELNFKAYKDDRSPSILSYLTIKFKNCEAKVGSDELMNDPNYDGNYIECNINFTTDPLNTEFTAKITGKSKNFTVHIEKEVSNKYTVYAHMNVFYESHAWHGKGKVTGWLNKKMGNSTLTVNVNENIEF